MTVCQIKQAINTARTVGIFTGALSACLFSLAFSSCSTERTRLHTAPSAVLINTVSDGQSQIARQHTSQTAATPADWTENPLTAVVYEPVSE